MLLTLFPVFYAFCNSFGINDLQEGQKPLQKAYNYACFDLT